MLRIAHEGLTFDDVLLLPGYSEVTAKDVSLVTRLTRNIPLNIPLVSAAMDTVTEARLAIALAQEGGIGIIHKNMTIAEQAEEVRRVKKFESGVVKDPITIESTASIAQLIDLTRANGISGVPVMAAGQLVGIVTRRDIRFETDTEQPVSAIMTPKQQLVTVQIISLETTTIWMLVIILLVVLTEKVQVVLTLVQVCVEMKLKLLEMVLVIISQKWLSPSTKLP